MKITVLKDFAHKGVFYPAGVTMTVTAEIGAELQDGYPDCFQVEMDQPPADTMIHGDEAVTK